MKRLVPALLLALGLLLLLPAAAPAATMTSAQLTKAVLALQGKVKTLEARQWLSGAGAPASALGKLGNLCLDTAALALYGPKKTAGWGAPARLVGPAGPQGLKGDAPYVSLNGGAMNGVAGPNIVFQGANVHVRSTTSESDTSSTGNLIVGWNAAPDPLPSPFRTGSNNLVVGGLNNFTSHGGLVAGFENTTSARYASVSGGGWNFATGEGASVSGGGSILLGTRHRLAGRDAALALSDGHRYGGAPRTARPWSSSL